MSKVYFTRKITPELFVLDQACLDLVYNSNDSGKADLIERTETRNVAYMLEAAAELGIGSREYELVNID